MTTVGLVKDWRVKTKPSGLWGLGGGEWFSSAEQSWIFVESKGYAGSGQTKAPLWLPTIVDLQISLLETKYSRWYWFAQPQSDVACDTLKQRFRGCIHAGTMIACDIGQDAAKLREFWEIYSTLSRAKPWNMETPWGVVVVDEQFEITSEILSEVRNPRGLFRHHANLNAIFTQEGWWATFGVRYSKSADMTIQHWMKSSDVLA